MSYHVLMNTVLFDLDGTLLPMDQEVFIRTYFSLLCRKLAPLGYEPAALVDALWSGTAAMVANDGKRCNMDVFWDSFASVFGQKVYDDMPVIDSFYLNEFGLASAACHGNPMAAKLVKRLKDAGYVLFLATNPVFPRAATLARIRWAGLDPDDFAGITTYEEARHSKPSLEYYRDILSLLDVCASDCLMVGNDTSEDMVASRLGMDVFLLTDCLINPSGMDVGVYPHGGFRELEGYIFK